MIDIDHLSYRYPGSETDALRGLSLKIAPGRLFGLLGPNGSGKTTLISILSGLLLSKNGSVSINGRAPGSAPSDIALVPQDFAFYPRLTVLENLRFFCGVQGLSAQRIDEALKTTGLTDARNQRAARLSGGMKRRLNIAVGLLGRPKVLFLDEPTVGIDPQSRRFILDAVKEINRGGVTVLYSSHYMEEVEALCDDVGILDEGRLLAQGGLKDLRAGHKDLEALFFHLTQRRLRD
jgi:ABC-2 type transport system ATP-binding protein